MADVSSSIEKEMEKYGPYPVKDRVVRKHREYTSKKVKDVGHNPYVKAFWEWLPEIYNDLKVLRLTGGEPLLDDNFDKLLDYIIENEHDGLTFAVNSNLCVSQNLVDNMFEKLNKLKDKPNIKIELYTSLDTQGKQAEYIRPGLNYNKVIKNIKRFQNNILDGHITVMCCFNILSFDSFEYFLDDIIELKKKSNILLDISYLKDPMYLCSKICTDDQLDKLGLLVKKMESSNFTIEETKKLKRIYIFLKSLNRSEFKNERRDFYLFINEFDRRKRMSFKDVFPSFDAL
jgi:organic radical activating enzyme